MKTKLAGVVTGVAGLLCGLLTATVSAQDTVEWLTLGSDYAHTRYSEADKIDVSNFDQLEQAWVWDGSSFGASSGRATPSYVDGKLVFVAGPRRHVIVADACLPQHAGQTAGFASTHVRR